MSAETYPATALLQTEPDLDVVTARMREHIVNMCASPGGGHLGGSMSLVEILATLYLRVMHVDPQQPAAADRDILLLSKGHGGVALYAALAEAGYFSADLLEGYGKPGSPFLAHPHAGVPGVEMPSGSLGHGLALGVGFALAHRLDASSRRCFVVMGDGELQEGSVWEAAAVAAHHGLDRLVAVIDRNRLQITGGTETVCRLEPLAERWAAFGWQVRESDGHDVQALTESLTAEPEPGRPTVVIAHTVKGKGITAVEGQTRSHFARLSEMQRRRSLALLRPQTRRSA